jgi:Xaa-Pro aminopeptidase
VTGVLIVGDTLRSPELRHEVPVPVPDPIVYVEQNGGRHVFAGSLELPRLAVVPGLRVHAFEELGVDELVAGGATLRELSRELPLRACRLAGLERASVPAAFPLDVADRLRREGVELVPAPELFDARRRVKTEVELAGVRRAQRAAEHAMAAIRERLRAGGASSESLRAEATRVFAEDGMVVPDIVIASHGPQTAVGHEPGSGPIADGEPVVVDLGPSDLESGCYADMTRTFCVGDPPAELVDQHRHCREVLEDVCGRVRAGVSGADLHRRACELFERAGYRTTLSKTPGEPLEEGFFHSLGHGVGLEVHERPAIGRLGDELMGGDVIAVEPGLYRLGFGGCRLEDLLLVTDDGCETLTDFPYELAP